MRIYYINVKITFYCHNERIFILLYNTFIVKVAKIRAGKRKLTSSNSYENK